VRITRKLRLLVAVPLIAVIAFAVLTLSVTTRQVLAATQVRALVQSTTDAGELVHQLQGERAAAVTLLAGTATAPTMNAYLQQVTATDGAVTGFQRGRAGLFGLPTGTGALLTRIDDELSRLAPLRKQIESGTGASLSAVTFQYRIVVADLLVFTASAAQSGVPSDEANRIRASAVLAQAAEYLAQEQVAVLRAVALGPLSPATQQQITATRTGFSETMVTFDALADPQWEGWLDKALATGADAVSARRLDDLVGRTPAGSQLELDPATWSAAIGHRVDTLRTVAQRIEQVILAQVTALRNTQVGYLIAETGGVVGTVLLALVLAVWLGRPMLSGLRQLSRASRAVAGTWLPETVARLRTDGSLGGLTPQEYAAQAAVPPLPAGRDEIAEVAGALAAVYRSAVRLAAEQSDERRSLGTIFATLARRGERILGRVTAHLDELERDEEDPRRLSQLFMLDNQVTLLHRTNRTLLVLGGEGSARVRAQDTPLRDLLLAAQSQIEKYRQVEIRVVDPGAAVRRDVVDDVVHLLAELLDNATSYADPNTPVHLDARLLGDRVLIQVSDAGIGIPADRLAILNARLASPAALDVDAVRAMGVTAVARIAHLYRLRVELRERTGGGTVAEVTLPATVLTSERPDLAFGGPPGVAGLPALPRAGGARHAAPDALSTPQVPVTGLTMTIRAGTGEILPADDTMELPIFHTLATGGWFTQPSPDTQWEGPADTGWAAAAAAAVPVHDGTTQRGLPRRRPMAQLVPGGVEEPPTGHIERDPRHTAASMAAFARGVGASRAASAAAAPAPQLASTARESTR